MRHPGRSTGRFRGTRRLSFVAVLALAAAACGGDGSTGDSTTTTSLPDTTIRATTATTEATSGPVELLIRFDGSGCTYTGPDRATLDDQIQLTLVNETDNAVRVGFELIPPDRLDEFAPLVGTDFDYSADLWIQPAMYADAGPSSESSASAYLAADGTYLVNCVLREAATPVHSWWPVVVEVTR